MKCPDCRVQLVVYRTVTGEATVTRTRHCPVCRRRFLTAETIARSISDCSPNVKRMAREVAAAERARCGADAD